MYLFKFAYAVEWILIVTYRYYILDFYDGSVYILIVLFIVNRFVM